MKKLFVVGPHSVQSQVISTLHKKQVAHVVDHKKDEFDIGTPAESLEHVSQLLVQVRSLCAQLNVEDKEPKTVDLKTIESSLPALSKEVTDLVTKHKQHSSERTTLETRQKLLTILTKLGVSPSDLQPSNSYEIFLGNVENDAVIAKLKKITPRMLVKGKRTNSHISLAIFVQKDHATKVEDVLSSSGFSAFDLSPLLGLDTTTKEAHVQTSKQLEQLTTDQETVQLKLNRIASENGSFLQGALDLLTAESEKASAPLRFGSTANTFFLTAYVPAKQAQQTKKSLMEISKEKLYIEEQRLKEDEQVPIKLNNPKGINNFEFFTNLYGLPQYKEFDPTWLMAFTFPLFFGFMLGDIVYGLVMIILFSYLKKKFPVGKEFFTIMIFAGISAMLFGVAFGEILGFEPWGSHGAHGDHGAAPAHDSWYPILERTIDFVPLMIIAGLVGVIHVNFGLLLGTFIEIKNHGVWHAITHKVSWIILQVSFVLLYFGYGQGTIPIAVGWAVFGLAVGLIYKAEGFIGVLELPTILSHTLSYMRLMAVGLASVFIAVMVNQLAMFLYGLSLWWLPVVVIVMVLGHTFAIGLGILSPSLHSIRLHYVEFFMKFYKGGGKEYTPFGAKKKPSLL